LTNVVVKAGPREWFALVVLTLPVLVISVTATVLSFALPLISAGLRPTSAELLWIVDVYAFVLAGLLIAMGSLGDRIGRRRLLLVGTVVLALSSVAAAFINAAWGLVLLRAVQGVAAAAVLPSTLSMIRTIFRDDQQRRFAIAAWAGVFAAGGAIGPIAGGALLAHFWWGSVFLANVPLLLPLLFAWKLLPEFRDPQPGPFDLAGAALSLAAVLPVIYGVKSIATVGFGWLEAVFIAGGIAIGVLFLRRQRRVERPMLDLTLFRDRQYSTAIVSCAMAVFALVGTFYFAAQYLQLVVGLGPLQAGLWTLPAAGLAAVGSVGAAALVKWIRPGIVIGLGMVTAALGVVCTVFSGLVFVVVGLSLVGLGIGTVQALASDMAVARAPEERAGAASAVLESAAEFGSALGVTVLGSVGAAVYHREMKEAAVPDSVRDEASQTLGHAAAMAERIGGADGQRLLQTAQEAFSDGMHAAAVIGAILISVTAVLAVVVLNGESMRRKK
jgi:DHA2 family multidrug resistance protein-like MFS transporter